MSQSFWDRKQETMPDNEKRVFQTDKLKEQLAWVYEKTPFYRAKFNELGVRPKDFTTLEDLRKFPFTCKSDLKDSYPSGHRAVPMGEIVRIHATSGTTGKPTPGFYTAEDIEQWTECMARGLWAQEVRPDTVVQNAFGIGLFTGGLGFHQGAERIGCRIIPTGAGLTERQILVIQDFGTTALTCTPSYCLTILERADRMGIDLGKTALKSGHFGAEPWSDELRREIEQRGGIRAHEHYGLTELMGPGVAFSCEDYKLHINEDHVLAEVVNPTTLEPVEPGTQGELVLTALQRRAMPLIRYRTRDITTLRQERCTCGRTLVVMDRVLGRTDDMMIISGVNVFPSQVEAVLMEFDHVEPVYQIRLRKTGYRDCIIVETETNPQIYEAGKDKVDDLAGLISKKLKDTIGIKIPVTIEPCRTIPRSEGKARRVVDER